MIRIFASEFSKENLVKIQKMFGSDITMRQLTETKIELVRNGNVEGYVILAKFIAIPAEMVNVPSKQLKAKFLSK